MKAISLLQPWATLVVIGAKHIETRSWNTNYRGDLLIHASKKFTKEQKAICQQDPFASALEILEELSLGSIIGSVKLIEITTTDFYKQCSKGIPLKSGLKYSQKAWENELAFGDYSPGRFGWLLSNPISFSNHVDCKGSLGLWDMDQRICRNCGCMDHYCKGCIEKTGEPCQWVEADLCSACIK